MIQDRDCVVDEVRGRILIRRFARPPGAAITLRDDPKVARKLRDLMDLPDFAVTRRLAEKHKGVSLGRELRSRSRLRRV